ncbi:hypothetical protein PSAC2689_50038 [Paraburkholderia sacchari]
MRGDVSLRVPASCCTAQGSPQAATGCLSANLAEAASQSRVEKPVKKGVTLIGVVCAPHLPVRRAAKQRRWG